MSQERKTYFDKSTTGIIKGIALIMMFIHHFFTFPERWVDGISYPLLETLAPYLCDPFKMCVPVFCFITGYFYYFNKDKSYRYSLKKITDIFVYYWGAFIALAIVAVCCAGYKYSVLSFVGELFALIRPTMIFCWYIFFYYVTMLLLPIFSKYLSKNKYIDCIVCFVLIPAVIMGINHFISTPIIHDNLDFIARWLPSICCGYLFACYGWFENVFEKINSVIKSKGLNIVFWIFLATAVLMSRAVIRFLDVIYAPVFIYSIVNLHRYLHTKFTDTILSSIGKYSMLMWFGHGIFFNNSKEVFQPILFLPHNPFLVLIWGLLLCYVTSVVFDFVLKRIKDAKNKLLFS